MASTGITFDMATFRRGLDAKFKASKKAHADVLNQAGGSICANAIRLTKRASKPAIVRGLSTNGLAFKLVQSRSFRARLPRELQAMLAGKRTRAEINAAVTRFIALRAASRGYIAAGWFKGLAVFRPNSKRQVSEKGLAAQGRATKATTFSLVATFENHARGAAKVGMAPLQQAFDEEGRSMQSYAEKTLAAALK
jgi:hypothetical protein